MMRTLSFYLIKAAMIAIAFVSVASAMPADAANWYVSRLGSNADGQSWATAWLDFNQINWSLINNNDFIIVDGGMTGGAMSYAGNCVVNKPNTTINIVRSTTPGHDGSVQIMPGAHPAFDIVSGTVYILGYKQTGIWIFGSSTDGITLRSTSGQAGLGCVISGVEVVNCRAAGIRMDGQSPKIQDCIVRDSAVNVIVEPTTTGQGAVISRCWIYNNSPSSNTDGVYQKPTNNYLTMDKCVIGPQLKNGVYANGVVLMSDCLLLSANESNLAVIGNPSMGIGLSNVTSFTLPLNPQGNAGNCLSGIIQAPAPGNYPDYPGGTSSITNSIFSGGVVNVPAPTYTFAAGTNHNTEYQVTGNTTLLSNSQVNPQFVGNTNVGNYPGNLKFVDFSLASGSPAAGTGSAVTSVNYLKSIMTCSFP